MGQFYVYYESSMGSVSHIHNYSFFLKLLMCPISWNVCPQVNLSGLV